jgi:hypothetical protein
VLAAGGVVALGVVDAAVALALLHVNAFLVVGAIAGLLVLGVGLLVASERVLEIYAVVLVVVPSVIQVQLGGFAFTTFRLFMPLVAVVFAVRALTGREQVRRSPLDFAVVAFALAIAIGFSITMDGGEAAARRYAVTRIVTFSFEYIALFYLVFWTVRDASARMRMTTILVAAMTLVAVYGLLEAATHQNYINSIDTGLAKDDVARRVFTRAELTRARSTFEHPISLGTALAMTLPLALHLTSFARRRAGRALGWGAFAVMLGCLVATVSRGPYVAAIIALALVFLAGGAKKARARLVLGLSVFAAAVVLFGWSLLERVFTTFAVDASVESRLVDYPRVLRIFKEQPLFGQGLGSLNPSSFAYVDNYFLKTLGELGLVGVVTLATLLVAVIVVLALGVKRLPPGADRSLTAAVLAAAVAFTLQTATFDSLSFSKSSGLYWVLVGLGMSACAQGGLSPGRGSRDRSSGAAPDRPPASPSSGRRD